MVAMNTATLPAPAEALVSNRRVAPRFQPAFGTICRIPANTPADSAIVGLVWNISETGVSMLMGNPPKAGSEVPGELTAGSGEKVLSVTLRVVHVRPIETGDFVLGAQFERPLNPEEIEMFKMPVPAKK
jgi:hypothetical protein